MSRDGAIPGALIIGRNVLEWRLDPASAHRIPEMTTHDQVVVVVCDEGYAVEPRRGVAAAARPAHATDLDGGFQAWKNDGLPVDLPDL